MAAIIVPGSQRLVASIFEKAAASLIRGAVSKVERDMEREADVYGILYAHAAGYDPLAGSDVWERFAVELPTTMTASLFASHPPSSERFLRIQKVADALLSGVPAVAILKGLPPAKPKEEEETRPASGEAEWSAAVALSTP